MVLDDGVVRLDLRLTKEEEPVMLLEPLVLDDTEEGLLLELLAVEEAAEEGEVTGLLLDKLTGGLSDEVVDRLLDEGVDELSDEV